MGHGFRVASRGLRVLIFVFRGAGCWVSISVFRVAGRGFWVSGFEHTLIESKTGTLVPSPVLSKPLSSNLDHSKTVKARIWPF